ncbi:MAG TPA: hypothetical protein VJ521_05240, partial [Acidobacteriota bacterium]|nr:hypothetical protein [Acidobacteriota bacterium]
MRYVKVAFPKSPLAPLTYSVPESYPDLQQGMRVIAPVGPRFLTGFVIGDDVEPRDFETKSIVDLLDTENLFSPVLLKLTNWVADYYMADFADVLKAALPPALEIRPQTLIRITETGLAHSAEHAILQVLQEKKNLPLKEIYRLFGHRGTFSQLRALEQKEYLEITPERKRKREAYNSIELVEGSPAP